MCHISVGKVNSVSFYEDILSNVAEYNSNLTTYQRGEIVKYNISLTGTDYRLFYCKWTKGLATVAPFSRIARIPGLGGGNTADRANHNPDWVMIGLPNDINYATFANALTFTLTADYFKDTVVLYNSNYYRAKNDIEAAAANPNVDSTNWALIAGTYGITDPKLLTTLTEYTFFKNMSSVRIYKTDVTSISDENKENFVAFTSNLNLRDTFSTFSFSEPYVSFHNRTLTYSEGDLAAFVINNKIEIYRRTSVGGDVLIPLVSETSTVNWTYYKTLDKNSVLVVGEDIYYESTDGNRYIVLPYGTARFKRDGLDLLMEYFYEKDVNGYPKTGEFIGKILLSDPCGNFATTYLCFLLDTDVSIKLNQDTPIIGGVDVIEEFNVVPYNLRFIFNQKNNSFANIKWSGAINGTHRLSKGNEYDNAFTVDPNSSVVLSIEFNTLNSQTLFDFATVNGVNFGTIQSLGNNNYLWTGEVNDITENKVINLSIKGN